MSFLIYSVSEDPIFGVRVSSGSAETLVRTGEGQITFLIEYSLSNISAKNYQNWLRCVEVNVQHQCHFFKTQCITKVSVYLAT